MSHISIRDLQKMSAQAIAKLPGPTTIKSGDKTVGVLIPYRKPEPRQVDAFLALATETRRAALARGLDEAAESARLEKLGPVEPIGPLFDGVMRPVSRRKKVPRKR